MGGVRAALVHLSVAESCKPNEINSCLYMRDVVSGIHGEMEPLASRECAEQTVGAGGWGMGIQASDTRHS